MQLRGDVLPPIIVGSGLLFLAVNRLVFSIRHGKPSNELYWLAFQLLGIGFIVGRIVERVGSDANMEIGARIQYAGGFLLCATAGGAMRSYVGDTTSRRVKVMIVLAVVSAIACLFTDVLVHGPVHRHIELFGHIARFIPTTPLLDISLGSSFVLLVIEARAIRRRPQGTSLQFRRLSWLGAIIVVLAINDTLDAAGVISTLQVLEYGFALIVFLPTHDELDRMVAAKAGLEDIVIARTSELERDRALLDAGQARFRRLADASEEAVLRLAGGRVVDGNGAAMRMFGEHLIGTDVQTLIAQTDRPRVEALLAATTTSPTPSADTAIEVDVLGRTGEHIVSRVRLGGDVVLIRDIREDKMLQQSLLQADRLAALGTLAAGTAHEINNPLAYVLGNTECLIERLPELGVDDATSEEIRALLDDILDGGQRVRKIVSKMVALSRDLPETGPCDLHRTIDDALAFAGHQLHHRAEVSVELADLPLVVGDAAHLGQVFRNLIINAFQAIPAGKASSNKVTVTGRREGATVVVEIADTGGGIDPSVLGRIFDPFFTTKRVGEGTGLGLSICHSVITSLGGTITAESVVGRGTTFKVTLPIADVAAPVEAPAFAPAKPLNILVIDDEMAVARSLARMLRHHQTEIITDGELAHERCIAGTFDVILCDLMLPNRSGMEIYRSVLERDPACASKMLFITGGVFTGEAEAFLDTMPDRWLAKPVNTDALRAAVARIARAA